MARCTRAASPAAALVLIGALVTGCAGGGAADGPGDVLPPAPSATAAAPSSPAAPGPGRAVEDRPVSGVTGVELSAVGDLEIVQSGTESLRIEADADVLPRLTSDVTGGILRLGVAPGETVETRGPIVYRLSVTALDSLTVSGAGDATVRDLRTARLAVDLDGAGGVTAAGTADALVLTIDGAGDFDGEGLQTTTADVTVDGAGSAVVRVSDRLDAQVDGVGSVEYLGDPQVNEDVGGVGSVQPR
jgi:hypothetical protein